MSGIRGVRRTTAAAVIALVAAAATACGGDEPPPRTLTTTDFLGQPVAQVYAQMGYVPGGPLPSGFGITTYEMGPAITKKPALDGPGNSDIAWLTVAACYSDTPKSQLTLGVIPMSDSTPQIVSTAKARGYDRYVRECPGTGTTFTLPPAE
ncbi:hypothetical protein [Pseudonocardia endophytica]|uniref:Uncharacterized protein n=1 Tax=Pseudonocardia endophytica TaxID=401976 RepID=A0A4R1HS36_PSEEN|nr:hypothetical protein [Pseudonocardia endophytica]TCK25437.1 hypothetical protein EV378_1245 [Pseudonocardia endophytica]